MKKLLLDKYLTEKFDKRTKIFKDAMKGIHEAADSVDWKESIRLMKQLVEKLDRFVK